MGRLLSGKPPYQEQSDDLVHLPNGKRRYGDWVSHDKQRTPSVQGGVVNEPEYM